jgi:hypothetical protein
MKNPEFVAKNDNWIDLLYGKLFFDEKFIATMGENHK